MIVCTRCATPNEDQERYCERCGHKLQSGRSSHGEGLPRPEDISGLTGEGGGWFRGVVWRCLETWGAVILLGASVAYGLATRVWWPVLGAAVLALLLLRLRRL